MKKISYLKLSISTIILLTGSIFFMIKNSEVLTFPEISNIAQFAELLPKNTDDIEILVNKVISQTQNNLNEVLNTKEHNLQTSLIKLDRINSIASVYSSILELIELTNPNDQLRSSAHEGLIKINNFIIDKFAQNKNIHKILKEVFSKVDINNLDTETKYTIEEDIKSFKKYGLELPDDTQEQLKALYKELSVAGLEFEQNIATDNKTVLVGKEELSGLDIDFINNLKMQDEKYILTLDYPTVTNVMDNCSIEKTRKSLWEQFAQRGYPKNKEVLINIINLRNKLAKTLGFESYTDFDIDGEMAESKDNVSNFLTEVQTHCQKRCKQEIALLKSALPSNISLDCSGILDGKIKPWDMSYIKNYYKKTFLSVDENEISKYFALENTLTELLKIYEEFLSIKFVQVDANNLWSNDLKSFAAYKNNRLLGHVILDLFPRANKFTHACQATIVPTILVDDKIYPVFSVVIANFPKATQDKPALLQRNDVITFFHEFGHAIHAMLGTTKFAGNSGTHTTRDFVEMPSQMLEEWMWQPQILAKISKHYQTGKSLSDEQIKNILSLKNFSTGIDTIRQIFFARFSLECFNPGEGKDLKKLFTTLQEEIIDFVLPNENNHGYAAFSHLIGYGAKYYGYLWSKVYALDLFKVIQENNFSSEIGQRYIDCVLSKGGSDKPMNLLKDFLQREPNSKAFFENLG